MSERESAVRMEPLAMRHAPEVQRYVSDPAIPAMMDNIPQPYPPDGAADYIRSNMRRQAEGKVWTYAAMVGSDLVGVCSIRLEDEDVPVLGYWIGKPFWGRGYGSAAAKLGLKRFFSETDFRLVWSASHARNPASIRILEKCGFQRIEAEKSAFRSGQEPSVYFKLERDWFAAA